MVLISLNFYRHRHNIQYINQKEMTNSSTLDNFADWLELAVSAKAFQMSADIGKIASQPCEFFLSFHKNNFGSDLV